MDNAFDHMPPEQVAAESILRQRTTVGALQLPHRLAMAPMTRDRSAPDGTPTATNVEYYRQRASTGLIITEGTQPSADGQGYLLTPGIYTDDHVAGWARVIDAVHQGGGRPVVQLMHVGRISHPDNTPHHRQPVAPSSVAPSTPMFTAAGMQPIPEPRAPTQTGSTASRPGRRSTRPIATPFTAAALTATPITRL